MCGIAGLYDWPRPASTPRPCRAPSRTVVRTARGSTASTLGPGHVQLAHRRLAIIDLSTEANQPFVKDGLVLVYNGELYNYRELRAELEGLGVRFRTAVRHRGRAGGLARWGPASLRRLRGMFAFAIYDEATRPPGAGARPLRHQAAVRTPTDGNGVAFCSELKASAARARRGRASTPTAIVASLLYYWVPESHCAVQGVQKLPPGHWAEVAPGRPLQVHQYWSTHGRSRERPAAPVAPSRSCSR